MRIHGQNQQTSEPTSEALSVPVVSQPAADYSGLIWQQLREMQHSLTATQESQARLTSNFERLDDKVGARIDKLEGKLSAQIDGLKTDMIEVKAEIKGMKSSIDSTKSKVEDLANLKHKIIGGAIVFGAVLALLGAVVTKASDYITFKAPTVTLSQPNTTKP